MYHVTHPLISAEISTFSLEIIKFCYIKKHRYRLHFEHDLQYFNFKDCFNEHGYNFDDVSKNGYSKSS